MRPIVTATSATEPVLRRDWLAQGTHINAVGASYQSYYETFLALANRTGTLAARHEECAAALEVL